MSFRRLLSEFYEVYYASIMPASRAMQVMLLSALTVFASCWCGFSEVPETKLGDIGYVADVRFTTLGELEDLNAIFDDLSVSVDPEPGWVVAKLNTLQRQCNVRYYNSDDEQIKLSLSLLMVMIDKEIGERSTIAGLELNSETMQALWAQNGWQINELHKEWMADPMQADIGERAIGLWNTIIELMTVGGSYNVMFQDSYIEDAVAQLEEILDEENAPLRWQSLVMMLDESTDSLDASADARERMTSEYLVIAGTEPPGTAEKRFFRDSAAAIGAGEPDASAPLDDSAFTNPFGEDTSGLGSFTDAGSPPAPDFSAPSFSANRTMEELKAEFQASEAVDMPRLVRLSLQGLGPNLTPRQETALADWITRIMEYAVVLEQQWQILWDYIIGFRVQSALRLDRVSARLSATPRSRPGPGLVL